METFQCTCGGRLFFNNTFCINCGSEVAWCEALPQSRAHRARQRPLQLRQSEVRRRRRQVPQLRRRGRLQSRVHASIPAAHRRSSPIRSPASASARPAGSTTSSPTSASREITIAGPTSSSPSGSSSTSSTTSASATRPKTSADELPLQFDFKANTPDDSVLTGHADGLITINLNEADSVERERVRKQMHEPHRSLIGHFRHEVGHYYWMTLVEGKCEDAVQRRLRRLPRPALRRRARKRTTRPAPPPAGKAAS